jgi:hypothetical protein
VARVVYHIVSTRSLLSRFYPRPRLMIPAGLALLPNRSRPGPCLAASLILICHSPFRAPKAMSVKASASVKRGFDEVTL